MRKLKHDYKLPKGVREISLRPYPGRLFAAYELEAYLKACVVLFGQEGSADCHTGGKFSGGPGLDGMQTYLIYGMDTSRWAHEILHVIIDLLPKLGFDLNNVACDEAACYLMQSIMADVLRIESNQTKKPL